MTVAPIRPKIRRGVGESIERPDAAPKVKGEFQYGSDLWREGMLFGATLRSPHPHARIVGIDTGAAKKMSGVKAIITAAELPTRELFGLMKLDQPVLASGKVRYVGEPVAIVAAETAEEARLAARAIAVRYEPLAAITDPVAALQPDATWLHQKGNVIEDILVEHGDPEAGAEVVVEGEYELGMQDQAALGPEAGLAIPRQDGGVELHIATQWLHEDLRQIAPCLGLPESKVHLVLAGVGGAFGAREDVTLQIHTCLLALATKRPVRMTYGREESFYGHVHRHPAKLWYSHGATKRGDLRFVRATIVLDGGAYASSSPAVVANAACFAAGPYRVPNARIHTVGAYTNNPPTGAMRGFGAVQSCFAYESQMDKLPPPSEWTRCVCASATLCGTAIGSSPTSRWREALRSLTSCAAARTLRCPTRGFPTTRSPSQAVSGTSRAAKECAAVSGMPRDSRTSATPTRSTISRPRACASRAIPEDRSCTSTPPLPRSGRGS